MSTGLLARAQALAGELTALRRSLHQEPELSYQERDTQLFLRQRLEAAGFTCRVVADTGLLAFPPATARGRAGPVVALRAELDALPIHEANEVSYRSRRDGVMHACGHDAHMTMVFGAGQLLASLAESLPGSFVLLFQPAEEVPPGGARRVLDEGVLAEAGVEAIFGLHVDTRYPSGSILLRKGPLMAASDRFRLTVIGKGGHAGYPHLAVDAVVIAAQIVLGLQAIVARRLDPMEPGVVSIGRIEGGTADNILPERVTLSGTLRSHSSDVRRQLPEWIREIATGIASGAGARVEFEYLPGHPGLSNDPAVIDFLAEALASDFDTGQIIELTRPIMGGEDFAHYLEVMPGAFLRLGVRNEAGGIVHPIHSPRFNLDESALPVGAAALAIAARAWLTRSAAG
ncbi:MAG: amidohydrolase [Candidatus Eisenbacteria bacterium]|nr:amidohydrolase [Candidatus Eisenbacteria bacterium]